MRVFFIIWILITYAPSAFTQEENSFAEKYKAYKKQWIKNKLHLSFSQEKYLAGDTVWFSAYFVQEDLKCVKGKQLIRLLLTDTAGEVKAKVFFPVSNGTGYGHLIIPKNTPPGLYLAVAYDNQMRNFGSESFFTKEILIAGKNKIIPRSDKPLLFSSGNLVSEVNNRICIRLFRNESDLLIYESGNVVLTAKPDVNGMACFDLYLKKGKTYTYSTGDGPEQHSFPLPSSNGICIRRDLSSESALSVHFEYPEQSPLLSQKLTYLFTTSGKVLFTQSAAGASVKSLQIPVSSAYGVVNLSVLNESGQLIAARDFYLDKKPEVTAVIEVEKIIISPREKIKAEIGLRREGLPAEGTFMISVSNSNPVSNNDSRALTDCLRLPSDPLTCNFLMPDDPRRAQVIDNYMICHTDKIRWDKILSSKIESPFYFSTTAIERSGRAYFAGTGQPLPDLTQISFFLQKNKKFYQTFVTNGGRFSFALPDFEGDDKLFSMAITRDKKDIPDLLITWDVQDTINLPHARSFIETHEIDDFGAYSINSMSIDKAFHVYNNREATHPQEQPADGWQMLLGKANISLNIQEYTLFPTISELIHEVIPGMYYRKKKKGDLVRVKLVPANNLNNSVTSDGNPLFVIDGMATKRVENFLSLKPIDIISIQIYNDMKVLTSLGILGRNGIVIVKTKTGNPLFSPDLESLALEGICARLVYVPIAASKQEIPRFRSLLYWNPSLIIKDGRSSIEFNSSDDLGTVRIRIEGLTKEGEAFSAWKEVSVLMQKQN